MGIKLLSLSLVLLCAPFAVSHSQVALSFEEFTGMSNAPGSVIPANARLSDQYLAAHGIVFRSLSPYVAVVNIGVGHAADGRNALGGSTADEKLSYVPTTPIEGQFFRPGDISVRYATDSISVTGDRFPAGATMRLRAYDAMNRLVGDVTAVDGGLTVIRIALDRPIIHRWEFLGTGNVAIDLVTFSQTVSAQSGDVNGDGCVDDIDLASVLEAFGQSGPNLPEDLNGDGFVDDTDLALVLEAFGNGC